MRNKGLIWLLSEKGILAEDGSPIPNLPFQNDSVTAGNVHKPGIAVIINKHEVWTLIDDKWEKILTSEIKLNCICWVETGGLLLGTEQARLAWARNGELDFIESFDLLLDRKQWYTPWGAPPDVRSLSVATDGTIYANIHVGWIARSKDNGNTWQILKEQIEMDVHQVVAHPTNPNIVFAATADGFFISSDYGKTFVRKWDHIPEKYQRACACFAESNIYLVSVSNGPHGNVAASLYRSKNEGDNWEKVDGLPASISDNIDTYQIASLNDGIAYIIVNNTSLFKTRNYGKDWIKVEDKFPRLFGMLAI